MPALSVRQACWGQAVVRQVPCTISSTSLPPLRRNGESFYLTQSRRARKEQMGGEDL